MYGLMFGLNVYRFVLYIQEWPLRWRLKLIVMISLSIHMMTSKDHICVQCVTNGSQQKGIWNSTNKYIMLTGCTMNVFSVRNVLLLRFPWSNIWIFTAGSISALNAESVSAKSVTWWHTDEFILERNYLNVLFVGSDLHIWVTLLFTAEFTVETNHTNVLNVTRYLLSLEV